MTTWNWNYIGHAFVGTVITACQATALADPTTEVMNVCHIITLVAIQLGASFGVWQASQLMQMRKDMLTMKPSLDAPLPPPPALPKI